MKKSIIFAICGASVLVLLYVLGVISYWGVFGLLIVLAVAGQVWYASEKKREQATQRRERLDQLKQLPGFTASKRLVGPWGLIALDEEKQLVAIQSTGGAIRKYGFADILGCEILEDGKTKYKKSNAIGMALLGWAVAGGAGALTAVLSAPTEKVHEVKTLDLRISVRDDARTAISFRVFDAWEQTARTKKSVKTNDSVYGQSLVRTMRQLNDWREAIELVLATAEEVKPVRLAPSTGIAEEVRKLHELKEAGILTDKEFEQQKAKLLN